MIQFAEFYVTGFVRESEPAKVGKAEPSAVEGRRTDEVVLRFELDDDEFDLDLDG